MILLAVVAAMLMDHVWYVAGARGSTGVLRLYRRLSGYGVDGDRPARGYVSGYGPTTILLGRFFTSVRALTWPVAAAHGMKYMQFLAFDFLAAGLWASIWVLFGRLVAERWRSAAETAGTWLAVAGIVGLVIAVIPIVMRLRRRDVRRSA